MKCDHGNDEDVKQLFETVKKEQNGRLDVLVNNAYKGVQVSQWLSLILQYISSELSLFRVPTKD